MATNEQKQAINDLQRAIKNKTGIADAIAKLYIFGPRDYRAMYNAGRSHGYIQALDDMRRHEIALRLRREDLDND